MDSILHIFNIHLQASYTGTSESDLKLSVETRLDNIYLVENVITQYLEKISNEDTVVLLGDFNVNSRLDGEIISRESHVSKSFISKTEIINENNFDIEIQNNIVLIIIYVLNLNLK